MGCKGCFAELVLGLTMLAVAASFVWATQTQDLTQFGTVTHQAMDGTMKENPICLFGMIGVVGLFVIVAAVMLTRAEKKASDDVLLAPVAKAGCGKVFAMLAGLFVCGLLTWIFSMVGGL